MFYAPLAPIYRSMLAVPNVVLTNCMACRVYRNAKLEMMEPVSNLSLPPSEFHGGNLIPLSFRRRDNPSHDGTLEITKSIQIISDRIESEAMV